MQSKNSTEKTVVENHSKGLNASEASHVYYLMNEVWIVMLTSLTSFDNETFMIHFWPLWFLLDVMHEK